MTEIFLGCNVSVLPIPVMIVSDNTLVIDEDLR